MLLAQIPPERSGKDARWDFSRPLDISFYAIQQESTEHRQLGIRLLTLVSFLSQSSSQQSTKCNPQLINLSATIYLDFPIFINSMFNILSISPRETVLNVLTLLPPSPAVLRFKVSLCQRLLSSGTTSAQPRPSIRPRAQPKPRDSTSLPSIPSAPSLPTIARKFTGPGAQDVVRLVSSSNVKSDSSLPVQRIRFELLLSYNLMQTQSAAAEQDQEWKTKRSNGELEKVVKESFAGTEGEGPIYRQMLQAVICV